MTAKLFGLHHVTAISRSARRTTDFYVNVLGLRLVKQTINHDDPENYHLFLGDQAGRPGSLLTLFPRPTAPNGSYRRILVMA